MGRSGSSRRSPGAASPTFPSGWGRRIPLTRSMGTVVAYLSVPPLTAGEAVEGALGDRLPRRTVSVAPTSCLIQSPIRRPRFLFLSQVWLPGTPPSSQEAPPDEAEGAVALFYGAALLGKDPPPRSPSVQRDRPAQSSRAGALPAPGVPPTASVYINPSTVGKDVAGIPSRSPRAAPPPPANAARAPHIERGSAPAWIRGRCRIC